ncbi:MAG: NADH-quinone oxidoreductase subunit A [Pseudomonadota bacterium]
MGTEAGAAAAALQVNQDLWPFALYAFAVAGLLAATLGISRLIGSATPRTSATDQPFESGVIAAGEADQVRLTIEFYLIAMFFVIFDLEAVFIFAWAVAFEELGWRGYVGASVFILVLLLALLYEWRTGVLDWGVLKRTKPPQRPETG